MEIAILNSQISHRFLQIMVAVLMAEVLTQVAVAVVTDPVYAIASNRSSR